MTVSPTWLVLMGRWVVIVCALVVIAAVVWASTHLGKGPGAKAAPAAGASAQ